jgi:Fuc2NAc and GlcNAc transferase
MGTGLLLFLFSVILVWIFYQFAIKRQALLDIPNARSSHHEVTPRGGGIVFALLWLLILLIGFAFHQFSLREVIVFFPGTFMISLLGYWDDCQDLTVKKRLTIQSLVAILCVTLFGQVPALHLFSQSSIHLSHWGVMLTVLGLIWSTNLYNFMDGLDGMAAVEALFVFGMGGLLFWHAGALNIACLVWALLPLVGGFLVWNWPPKARIFMGDSGSYCLGFLVALFALIGDRWYNIPVAMWVILYGIFWFDATLTLLRRLLRGENLSIAHREHAFHRLQRVGFSHAQMLYGLIVLNTVFSAIVIWALFEPNCLKWGLRLTLVILLIIYWVIEKLKPMERVIKLF